MARGPGIKPGSEWAAPATNVDISPTLLALAGITGADAPAGIDGHSFLSFILPSADEPAVPEYVRPALRDEIAQRAQAGWRQSVFVHHYQVGAGSYCGPGHHIDQEDNNFIAVRHLPGSKFGNVLYSEFQWSNATTCKHHQRWRACTASDPHVSHADGPGNSDFEEPFWFELFDLDKGKRRRFSSLLHAESCRPQSFVARPVADG